MNFGTIVSIIYGIGKAVWFFAKIDSRVEALETGHTKDLNSAFQKIRNLETINQKTGEIK